MTQGNKPPVWFWVVSGIMLVWNLLGIGSFFQNVMMSEDEIAAMSAAEQELYNSYPTWANIAFFVAVFGSSLGCLGLLLRKAWAKMVLVIGFLGIAIQMTYNVGIANTIEVYGPGSVSMPIMIIIFGLFLIWFANYGIKKNWLT